ncbi:hypothetical protein L2E82_48040 [Cichorium intybus]|uniref:Uncharacterized protein n=1 Tax=Cichorium intybus TaxID=13427 RepID=A0ACB8YX76_CICIN|nr:hypothetical protein L2E82_48040 [Cichorium intybus]
MSRLPLVMKGGKSKSDTKKADSRLAVQKKAAPAQRKAPAKKAKEAKDPKRPASAFLIFMEDFRKQFKEKHPNNKSVSVVSIAPPKKLHTWLKQRRGSPYGKTLHAYNKKLTEGKDAAEEEEEEESDKSKSEVHNDEEDDDSADDDDDEDGLHHWDQAPIQAVTSVAYTIVSSTGSISVEQVEPIIVAVMEQSLELLCFFHFSFSLSFSFYVSLCVRKWKKISGDSPSFFHGSGTGIANRSIGFEVLISFPNFLYLMFRLLGFMFGRGKHKQ